MANTLTNLLQQWLLIKFEVKGESTLIWNLVYHLKNIT
jgi:hypothetical protein